MSNYRTDVEGIAEALKALANPSRLRILTRLVNCCPPGTRVSGTEREGCACVGDLGRDLGIAPSTVSHHIKELHHAGLIRMERRGQHVDCWIDAEMLEVLAGFFGGLAPGVSTSQRGRRTR